MDENTARRLARLKIRPTMADKTDEFLVEMLTESLESALDYTHRTKDLGQEWDGIIIEMAVVRANQLGIEGASDVTEGAVHVKYQEQTIRPQVTSRLNSYRLCVGVSEE